MCNTYNIRGNMQQLALFSGADAPAGVDINYTSIHPDYVAPVIRRSPATSRLEIVMMRWGLEPPPGEREKVTNARNLGAPFWKDYLGIESRCLVPATSFAEWSPQPNPETGKKEPVWFALNSNRSPFMFAGFWTQWTGTRGTKKAPSEGDHLLYTFLTTKPNGVVKPIHYKSMPVILIPAALREDYLEACVIRDLSPKASATLIRRCLQGMIRDFCGISKSRLIDEIDELKDRINKNQAPKGVSSESVEAIDHIRQVGNIGAHMEKDINLIVSVDPDEAQVLIELVEMLFEEWYVERHRRDERLAQLKAIADKKKAAKSPPQQTRPGSSTNGAGSTP